MEDEITTERASPGRGFRLRASQFLPQPRDRVFEFFSDPCNLEALTPPWLRFTVLTPGPIRMKADALIDYQLRVHGISLHWQSRICLWAPPLQFIDEQVRGPYRRWRHEHAFEEARGGTICRDEVDYEVPFGWLANWIFVAKDLQKIFRFRHHKLREIFR